MRADLSVSSSCSLRVVKTIRPLTLLAVAYEMSLRDLCRNVRARDLEAKSRRHGVHPIPKVHEILAGDVVGSEYIEDCDAYQGREEDVVDITISMCHQLEPSTDMH